LETTTTLKAFLNTGQTTLHFLRSIRSMDALEAAIAAQEQASWLLQEATGEATDSKMAMLLAVHNKALELRLIAEAQYRNALKTRLEQ
jgi:hypothetical protein